MLTAMEFAKLQADLQTNRTLNSSTDSEKSQSVQKNISEINMLHQNSCNIHYP